MAHILRLPSNDTRQAIKAACEGAYPLDRPGARGPVLELVTNAFDDGYQLGRRHWYGQGLWRGAIFAFGAQLIIGLVASVVRLLLATG